MVDVKSTSTADIPHQFLKAAFLVGRIPFKALGTEPRVSYTLYIPAAHYNPNPSLRNTENAASLPPAYQLPRVPLVVSIHGTGRAAEQCRDSLISFADEAHIAVLAPLFPVGSEFFDSLNNYKVLRHHTLHADTALLDILDEVKGGWPGIATQKVFIIGFSGGGQFTHRFMYLHPDRLYAVSIGAPGRVTKLDEKRKWPIGTKNVAEIFGAPLDVDKIRRVAVQLVIGAFDTETHGGEEFWNWLEGMKAEHSKENLAEGSYPNNIVDGLGRGSDRVERLKELKEDWEQHGIQCQLDIVEGTSHEREKMLPAVIKFLRPFVANVTQELEKNV